VRLVGVRPDELDLDVVEVEEALRPDYLRVRVRDQPAAAHRGALPRRDDRRRLHQTVEERIAVLEGSPDTPAEREAEELRDVLRLGRLLLAGQEVTL
jgi:hypothetical protein